MLINKIKSNKCLLFYIGYFILTFCQMYVNCSFISKYYSIFLCLGYLFIGCFILTFFKEKMFDRKKLIKHLLLLFILAVFYIFSRDTLIFQIFLISIAITCIDYKKFLKNDLKIKTILVFLLIILSVFNIINSPDFYRENGLYRYSLGFQHPNILGSYIMIIIFEIYFSYYRKKFDIKFLILIILSILFQFYVPNCKSCFILLIIFMFYYISFFIKNINIKPKKYINFIIKFIFILIPLLSLFLGFLYKYNIECINKINVLLSNRLYYYNIYLDNVKLSFFGYNLAEYQQNYVLDNSYIFLILKFGIFQFLLILYYIYQIVKKLLLTKNFDYIFVLFILLLYGIMESIFLVPTVNVFILLITIIIKQDIIKKYDFFDVK